MSACVFATRRRCKISSLDSKRIELPGRWIDDAGHGPAYSTRTPDGHAVELYWETRRFIATPDVATAYKNQPQRYVPRGIAPRRLDHLNILARDVSATRRFFHELLGLRLTEQIIFDDGTEMGAWLSATNKSYDLAITRDRSGALGTAAPPDLHDGQP